MPTVLMTRVRVTAIAAALVAGLATPSVAVAASASPAAAAVTSAVAAASAVPAPSAVASAASRVPHYRHIAVIMFADHGFSNIDHNKHAPTFNRLARQYGLATRYYTTSDPDTAGIMALLAGNAFGVTDHAPYWDQQLAKPSLLSQLDAAHKSWKEYVQDIPYRGYLGTCYPTLCQETDTLYNQPKFNPVPDLASVADNSAEARKMVPAAELAANARAGSLPDFSFIDASECADMHGGPPWCQDSPANLGQPNDNKLVSGGDQYLRQVVHEIMSGRQWRHGNNAIVVTWTEGLTSAGCCGTKPGTGRVFTIVVTSHGPRHLTDGTKFNTYSLLATIQHAFGLGCLQHSCDTRRVLPMARLFGARADGPESFASAARSALPAQTRSATVHAAAGAVAARVSGAVSVADGASVADAVAAPAAATVTGTWRVVRSPNTGPNDNDLWSVAGRSPSDIWAVGSLLPDANATIVHTLALHYNGSKWSRVRTADVGPEANSLYSVAALPDGTAWATGIYTTASGHEGRALTEHWNGHAWTIVPAANPGSAEDILYGVTAVSDSDVWAVGSFASSSGFFHPLIEHWNGHSWTADPLRGAGVADGILTSVTSVTSATSATSASDGVWATGQVSSGGSDRQIVLRPAQGRWQVVREGPVRTPGGSVADAYPQAIAASAEGPWLAGNDRAGHTGFSTLVEAPVGFGQLSELITPNPTPQDNYLYDIAAVDGGAHAWAVGDDVPVATGNAASLIEYGSVNGAWATVPSPNPGAANGNTILDSVLAISSGNVWAVGAYDGANGMRTLIMHYTG
jgi:Phosphoesterase family